MVIKVRTAVTFAKGASARKGMREHVEVLERFLDRN